ncbi:MAG TPA: hypothetical protein VFB68_14425 [Xanthobacteraceae bacterium]|nr:hypothetical protein [Xanthobacteraceae bacterium]
MQNSRLSIAVQVALVIGCLCSAAPTSAEQRSGVGPCRQGVLALIGMLDDGDMKSADYQQASSAVIETCGPAARSKTAPKPIGTAQCRKLAGAMLDAVESGRLNGTAFAQARDAFEQGCSPR